MCFITQNFIANAKYEIGSLGYRPKKSEDLSIEKLNSVVCTNLLKLKNPDDAFYVCYHYNWVVRHLKKISKAMMTEKWQLSDIAFSQCGVKRGREMRNDVIVVTNLFSEVFCCIYAKNKKIQYEYVSNPKFANASLDTVEIDDEVYIFSCEYLKTLKKKKLADTTKAVAKMSRICIDYKKGKYVSYIIFDRENPVNHDCVEFAMLDIQNRLKVKTLNESVNLACVISATVAVRNIRH